jgi:hypothetical protein
MYNVQPVTFSEFKDSRVDVKYADSGMFYPPLPTPEYTIDGVPYWSRDSMIAFGKAVERCQKV